MENQQSDDSRQVKNQRKIGAKTQISIEHKLKIIELHNGGTKTKEICDNFNITEGTVRYIMKHQEKIKAFAEKYPNLNQNNRKKINGPHHHELEEHLMYWFDAVRSSDHPVNESLLKEKAITMNKELGGPSDFKASNGWVQRFKIRHGIRVMPIQGEESSTDFQASEKFKENFPAYLQKHGFHIANVYNASEAGINWRNLPQKSLVSGFEASCSGVKISKDQVTALVCANATGTHSLPILIIGKYKRPRCLNNKSDLPVVYMWQKSGLMDCKIFTDWYEHHFIPNVLQRQKLDNIEGKVLLLLDNAPSRPKIEDLNAVDKNFEVIYSPKNVTSLIQPMDEGVIDKMKKIYRKNILRNVLDKSEQFPGPNQFLEHFDLKQSCESMATAFSSLTEDNLKNAWKKWLPNSVHVNEDEASTNDPIPDTQILFQKIPVFRNYPIQSLNQWLEQDNNDPGFNVNDFLKRISSENIPKVVQLNPESSKSAMMGLQWIEGWLGTTPFKDEDSRKNAGIAVNFLKQIIITNAAGASSSSDIHADL